MDKAAETDVTTEMAHKRGAWELEREAQTRWATTGAQLHELQIRDFEHAVAIRDEEHKRWMADGARGMELREINEKRNAERQELVVREVKAFERIADALEKIAGAGTRK
jgi:hypothetical protein